MRHTMRESDYMVIDSKREKIILALIIVIGAVLRLIGYNWGGDGMVFNSDEFSVVEPVIYMVKNHSIMHHVWVYPAMCTSKLIAVILMPIDMFIPIGRFGFYYIVRVCYAVFSVMIIVLSYIMVKSIEGEKTALLFSFLLTINPVQTVYSKMAVGDMPAMVFWLLVVLFIQRYSSDKRINNLLPACFFAACSMMEKWNGAGITLFIAIGVILYNFREFKKMLIHAAIAFSTWFISIILIAPNIVKEFNDMISAVVRANPVGGSSLIYGQFAFFYDYLGIGAVILTLIGVYSLKDKEMISRFPYLFVIISLFVDWLLCEQVAIRHGFAIQWGCILLLTLGFEYLITKGRFWKSLSAISLFLIILSLLLSSILADIVAVKTRTHDTRVVGLSYLEKMGANIHNTIGESYTPYCPPIGDIIMDDYDSDFNMVNEMIYVDDDGNPCVNVPGKKYVITSEYKYLDRSSGGYGIIKSQNVPTTQFLSDDNVDLQTNFQGQGKWYYSEFDTIRNIVNRIEKVEAAETIGPSFKIYDISSFMYKPNR